MKLHELLILVVAVAGSAGRPANAAASVPASIASALNDPARPAQDRAQDAQRKPGEVLAYAAIKPGDQVIDLMPGSGYYTRLFSKLVGPRGKVYAVQPTEMDKAAPKGLPSLRSFAGKAAYPNVVVLLQPVAAMQLPKGVDLVWTSQNYHDLHDPFMGSPNMRHVNQAIYDALKPGGAYIVLDHAAAAGSGISRTDDLHRIDPAAVKAEITAVGFQYAGESTLLRNPADDHALAIFDKKIQGSTDKFIYTFRKPQP